MKQSNYNGTSGSEEVYESSMESIESSNSFALKPLSALSLPPQNKNKLNKVSSADSLLSMIRNLASNKLSTSTPSSPQLSETGDALSSGYPTPLSTPDTPNGSFLSMQTGKNAAKEKTKQGSQIYVCVLNPLDPKKNQESCENPESEKQSSVELPTISLEVPTFNYGKCLSPIKELPTPLPTPCPSPLPTPMFSRHDKSASMEENSGISDSSLSFGSSVSRSSTLRKLTNKSKSVPQVQSSSSPIKTYSISIESYSCDSGEGTFDQPDVCDAASDYSEISIPIPSFRSSSSSSIDYSLSKSPTGKSVAEIPIIMTSIYDSSENLCKPINKAVKSEKRQTRAKRLVKQSKIPPNIVIPQVSISFEDELEHNLQAKSPLSSNSSTNGSPLISPSGKIKKRPPPLVIPDSNFFNFKETSHEIKSAPPQESCKFIKQETDIRKYSSLECEVSYQLKNLHKESKLALSNHGTCETENKEEYNDNYQAGILTTQQDKSHFLGGKKIVMKQEKIEMPDSPDFLGFPEKGISTQRSKYQNIETIEPLFQIGKQPGSTINTEEASHNVIIMQAEMHMGLKSSEILTEEKEIIDKKNILYESPEIKGNEASWLNVHLGSPPLKKEDQSFYFKTHQNQETQVAKKTIQTFEQPQSLDCDNMAPMIKITPMSDMESDSDSNILHGKSSMSYINPAMDYLSPLTILVPGSPHQIPVSTCSSESNLSSSGYSSMASPGASRRGSFNRLCISESEDTNTPTASKNFFGTQHTLGFVRRPSPLLKSPSCDSESSDQNQTQVSPIRMARLGTRLDKRSLFSRYRTDSETTDDQNTDLITITPDMKDEGICVDLPEKNIIKKAENTHHIDKRESYKNILQASSFTLPEIVVEHCSTIPEQESTESNKSSLHNSMDETQETLLHSPSGSSSRSESPTMSDKSSALSALHAMQVLLPNTDSEGHFDSQSSEVQVLSYKKSPKKKEKRIYKKKISRSNSPTSRSDQGNDSCHTQTSPKKIQNKKRNLRSSNKFEFRTSSSTESLAATR